MKKAKVLTLAAGQKGKNAASQVPAIELNAKLVLIQQLIPIALEHVNEILQEEVSQLAGPRYSHNDENKHLQRWGSQRGSVYLAEQKVPIKVPRVRDTQKGQEVQLQNYQALQVPQEGDERIFLKILDGLSCRKFHRTARLVPEAFGLSRSTISRRFIRTSAKKLHDLLHRRLDDHEFVALVLDGKTLRKAQMIIALGITISGEKMILGFIESATENGRVAGEFVQHLIDRGLRYQQGLLAIVDGSKALRKAIADKLGDYAVIQRCQWHKRENVVSYLSASQKVDWRRKLQQAYEQPTYDKAKQELLRLRRELKQINQSAANSLGEGLEETLTLHRLGLFKELGVSLKTTNSLESINSQVERMTAKVSHWRNSEQRQRWVASALLEVEPRLRRVKGYRHLPQLQKSLQRELKIEVALAA